MPDRLWKVPSNVLMEEYNDVRISDRYINLARIVHIDVDQRAEDQWVMTIHMVNDLVVSLVYETQAQLVDAYSEVRQLTEARNR